MLLGLPLTEPGSSVRAKFDSPARTVRGRLRGLAGTGTSACFLKWVVFLPVTQQFDLLDYISPWKLTLAPSGFQKERKTVLFHSSKEGTRLSLSLPFFLI